MDNDNTKQNILDFPRSIDDIEKYCIDGRIIKFCKSNLFKYLSVNDTSNLIRFLLIGRGPDGEVYFKRYDLSDSKKFYQYNMSKFDNTNDRIKPEVFKEYREKLFEYIYNLTKNELQFMQGFKKDNITDEEDTYWIDKNATYELLRKIICDEKGMCNIKYDFENGDIILSELERGATAQRMNIDITTTGINIEYPVQFKYNCKQCGQQTTLKAYEVTSNKNNGLSCPGTYTYTNAEGELKTRLCKAYIYPDNEVQIVTNAYFYEINYELDGERRGAQGISFLKITPGKYEAVIFYITGSKTGLFHIIDIKKLETNIFKLPEKKENENYLFTLQQSLDKFVEEKTNMKIYGLYPVKCALILQKLANQLKIRLSFNIMIVGDPSTGKSLVLKYYSFLLNNYFNLSSNGLSISIPGLRGTRSTINLFGKDIKIVTIGHLGSYRSIHIDEAGENKELVQNLKSFLLEDNYSYDKTGSVGISNKRTSHVNISQNLDYEHVGQYRGAVRKAYKDLNMTMDGIEKEDWDESWDLFLPIHKYENPQLRKIIREKRLEFKQKSMWWIDGLDYALHERFPFYFYLVNEKLNEELDDVVARNNSREQIHENNEILRILYNNNLDEFFDSLMPYKNCNSDFEAFIKLKQIIKDYGFMFDARTLGIYQLLLKFSRIINQRYEYIEMDFDLIRWYLEKTNVKIDVFDTNDYKVQGPPNLIKSYEQQKVEEESKTQDGLFGLPDGEF